MLHALYLHIRVLKSQNKITYEKRKESFTSYQHGVDNMHDYTNASEIDRRGHWQGPLMV